MAAESEAREMKKESPARFSKIIVRVVIAFAAVYTAGVLVVFVIVGHEPSTLTTAVFAFLGGELLALAKMKLQEQKTEQKIEKEEDKEDV